MLRKFISGLGSVAIIATLFAGVPAIAQESDFDFENLHENTQTFDSYVSDLESETTGEDEGLNEGEAPVEEETPTPTEPTLENYYLDLTGTLRFIANEPNLVAPGQIEEHDHSEVIAGLKVGGKGTLSVDLSEVDLPGAERVTLTFAIPAAFIGESIPKTNEDVFDLLTLYVEDGGTLVATSAVSSARIARALGPIATGSDSATAVHKVWAVFYKPANSTIAHPNGSGWTVANVQNSLSWASQYWSDQSAGKITFELQNAASIPQFNSGSYLCGTQDWSLWDQAEGSLSSQGYTGGANQHMMVFFPDQYYIFSVNKWSYDCSGAAGLATIGRTINSGGVGWVNGATPGELVSSSYYRSDVRLTLAHELGHNLGFGHASKYYCSSEAPEFYVSGGCSPALSSSAYGPYGNSIDVMGSSSKVGALSSPVAIKLGLWPTSSFDTYYQSSGTATEYTLNHVGSLTGKRALVIEASDGRTYYVEYRSDQGADADAFAYARGEYASRAAAAGGTAQWHAYSYNPSVRVLMSFNQYGDSYPYYGETALIARGTGSKAKVDYQLGESFSTKDVGGVMVEVIDLTSTTATVRVSNTVAGEIHLAEDAVARVSTPNSSKKLTASLSSGAVLTSGVKQTWQWYRTSPGNGPDEDSNFTAVGSAGATLSYTDATAKDRWFKAKVTLTKTNYETVVLWTDPVSLTLIPSDSLNITGSAVVDGTLALEMPVFSKQVYNPATPDTPELVAQTITSKYTWKLSGKAISKATKSSYKVLASQVGKKLSATAVVTKAGYVGATLNSASTDAVIKATIAGTQAAPTVTINSTKLTHTAKVASDAFTTAGIAKKYQWYRASSDSGPWTAIKNATKSSYTPVAADDNKYLRVRFTASKTGYNTAIVYSDANLAFKTIDYDVDSEIVLDGIKFTSDYTLASKVVTPGVKLTYQWQSSSSESTGFKNISKATKISYTATAADDNKFIRLVITLTKAGHNKVTLISNVMKPAVVDNTPGEDPVVITKDSVTKFKATADVDFVAGAKATWQWYRQASDGSGKWAAIKGATKNVYTATASDDNKRLKAVYKISKTGYTSKSYESEPVFLEDVAGTWLDLDIDDPEVTATFVGTKMTAKSLVSATTPGVKATWQWYRSSSATGPWVAIKGATKSAYTVTTADDHKFIKAEMKFSKVGYQSHYSSEVLALNELDGDIPIHQGDRFFIKRDANKLTVQRLDGVTTPGVKVTYQWYRASTELGAYKAIKGATKSSYTVVSADKGKFLKVVTKITKLGYNSLTSHSTPLDGYGLIQLGDPESPLGIGLSDGLFTASVLTTIDTPKVKATWQWYRSKSETSGFKAISKATKSTYKAVAADDGYFIKAKWTLALAGHITQTHWTDVLPLDTFSGSWPVDMVGASISRSAAVLTAGRLDSIDTTGLKFTYQWYRASSAGGTYKAISKATKQKYTVTSADKGKYVKVRVKVSKLGYNSLIFWSDAIPGYGTIQTNSLSFNQSLTGKTFSTSRSGSIDTYGTTTKYQWYRNGVAIKGATGSSYVATSADDKKRINVRVTVSLAGHNSLTFYTPSQPLNSIQIDGDWDGRFYYWYDYKGRLIIWFSDCITLEYPTSVSVKYQWYYSKWSGGYCSSSVKKISGATKSEINVVTSKVPKKSCVMVKLTYKAAGYNSLTSDYLLFPHPISTPNNAPIALGEKAVEKIEGKFMPSEFRIK